MKLLIALLAILCISTQSQALNLQRADCTSPQEYLSHNGGNFLLMLHTFLPQAGLQGSIIPSATPIVDLSWTGITINALNAFMTLGGSPLAVINMPLGFICLELIP